MKVLVFGGMGFVGAHVVRRLIDDGDEVVALDLGQPDPLMPPLRDVRERVRFEPCDLTSYPDVLAALRRHPGSAVINLVTSFLPEVEASPLKGLNIHLHGLVNVLEAARLFDAPRIVYGSSRLVYGQANAAIHDEATPASPNSLYATFKLTNEYIGLHCHREWGLDFVALRFPFVYGWGRGQRRVISDSGTWIVDVFEDPLCGRALRLDNPGRAHSLVYIKDLVTAVVLALRASDPPERIMDVPGTSHSKAEVARAVQAVLPATAIELDYGSAPPPPPTAPPTPTWPSSRMARTLGYQPRYTLAEGVRDYLTMARAERFTW